MSEMPISNLKTIEQIIQSSVNKNKAPRKTGELGKDDFLNLLITQLRYQDPMKPMEDKEFIAQMAQFSALEQMQNMNAAFSSVKAFGLMGKYVKATIYDDKTGTNKVVEGVASSVKIDKSKTMVVVKGVEVPVESIYEVNEKSDFQREGLHVYSNMIGKECSGAVFDANTNAIVKIKGTVSAVERGKYEDYAVVDNVQAYISGVFSNGWILDAEQIKNILQNAVEGNKTIQLEIRDDSGENKVPVTARVRSFEAVNGRIKAVLDDVLVPVDSLISMSMPYSVQNSEVEAGGESI